MSRSAMVRARAPALAERHDTERTEHDDGGDGRFASYRAPGGGGHAGAGRRETEAAQAPALTVRAASWVQGFDWAGPRSTWAETLGCADAVYREASAVGVGEV
jgi:hypothetical protein